MRVFYDFRIVSFKNNKNFIKIINKVNGAFAGIKSLKEILIYKFKFKDVYYQLFSPELFPT